MKRTPNYQGPEALESRIAPATITATFTALTGALVVNLENGGEATGIEIFQVDKTHFRVQGGTGTDIGAVGVSFVDFTGKLKLLTIDGGNGGAGGSGDDEVTVSNIKTLTNITYNGKAGDDTLNVRDVIVKGPVTLTLGSAAVGEAGDMDSVTFGGAFTTISKDVVVTYGAGGGTVVFDSAKTTITGSITANGGTGEDSLEVGGGFAKVGKGIAFTSNGAADTTSLVGDSLSVTARNATIGKAALPLANKGLSIAYTGSADADTVAIDTTIGSLLGGISFAAGEGTNSVAVDGTKVKLGKSLLGQAILFNGGAGDDSLVVDVTDLTTSGSIELLGGDGANLVIIAGEIAKIGKSAPTVNLLPGLKSIVLTGTGAAESTLDLGVTTLTVSGITELIGGSDDSIFNLTSSKLTAGDLRITGGAGTDTVSIIADGSVKKAVTIALGEANSGAEQSVVMRSNVGFLSGLKFTNTVTVTSGSTMQDDSFTATNISVSKAFSVTLGNANSIINIDNIAALNTVNVNAGNGTNTVNIERGDFYGLSTFKALATIIGGAGNDDIFIGNGAASVIDLAVNRGSFLGKTAALGLTVTDSGGINTRNDYALNNLFKPGVIPTVTGTFTVI